MAELHVDWPDGHREVHEVRGPGTIISIGDSLLSHETVELGSPVRFGGRWRAWLRVRVHGPVMPSLVLLTQKRSRDQLVLLDRKP